MKQNIGGVDRVIRLVLGLAFIAASFYWKCWFCGIIGLIVVFTSVVGWCGLYQVFGINTCKIKKP